MKHLNLILGLLILNLLSCNSKKEQVEKNYPNVKIAGAMRNVMWDGELAGIIQLDTINPNKGLYGLGPVSYLAGELLINDGKIYVSNVLTDSTMQVERTSNLSAPFFVYANVNEWEKTALPDSVRDIKTLETFIYQLTKQQRRPFVFKLKGSVNTAYIHIQNLPKGTKVSSPKEAHQGQVNYTLLNEAVEIIGFFSTEHQGVFTHHDSFLHMHLITQDNKKMGHLDKINFDANKLALFLPLR